MQSVWQRERQKGISGKDRKEGKRKTEGNKRERQKGRKGKDRREGKERQKGMKRKDRRE